MVSPECCMPAAQEPVWNNVNGSNGPLRTDHARAITRITASSFSEN
jgi:hypothetical protein